MSFVAAAVSVGTAAVGGAISAGAAGSAADKQARAAKQASDLEYKMYQQTRSDQEPWRQTGIKALTGLENTDFQKDFGMENFQQDPGYQFRMNEGQKALERSAAARGGLNSGATLKALSRYGQDFASNEYGKAYDRFNADRDRRFGRLSSLAGVGQTATGALGQAGQNYATNVGNNTMGAANAAGAAGISSANQIGNTLSNLGKNWMEYSASKKV